MPSISMSADVKRMNHHRLPHIRASVADAIQPRVPNELLAEAHERRDLTLYRTRRPLAATSVRTADLIKLIPDPLSRFGRPTPKSDVDVKELFMYEHDVHNKRTQSPPPPGVQTSRNYDRFEKDNVFGVKVDADWSGKETRMALAWSIESGQAPQMETTTQAQGRAILEQQAKPSKVHPHEHRAARDHGNILTWGQTNATWASARKEPPAAMVATHTDDEDSDGADGFKLKSADKKLDPLQMVNYMNTSGRRDSGWAHVFESTHVARSHPTAPLSVSSMATKGTVQPPWLQKRPRHDGLDH